MPIEDIQKASIPELKTAILNDPEWAECNQTYIRLELCARVAEIGWLWDKVSGVDPRFCPGGRPKWYGTPNQQSMTYLLRKAVGYSYP
jgi:hypothetical protein